MLSETDGQISILERNDFGRGSVASGAGDALSGEYNGREGIRDWVYVGRSWRRRSVRFVSQNRVLLAFLPLTVMNSEYNFTVWGALD